MLLSVIGFLVMLGPLVVIHEFGHYIFARMFGVKAEIFSIGFGPKLWSKQLGETELRVSAIPLGGYVKLLGEESDADLSPVERKRALHNQQPWKRFFIFFAGPLFNFLTAIVLFVAILIIGEPQLASYVGRVVHGSKAEMAGFRSGDQIVQIEGKPVTKFEDVAVAINENPDKSMQFQVLRKDSTSPVAITAVPHAEDGFTMYGEATHVGEIDGLLPAARSTTVGISDPSSFAAKAGMKTGDQITSINGTPFKTWEELEDFYSHTAVGTDLKFGVKRGAHETFEKVFRKSISKSTPGKNWGLHSSELFVERTVAKDPADQAGVHAGDRLIAVAGQEVESFYDLKDAVQKSGETTGKVNLKWEHEGAIKVVDITPKATEVRDPLLKKTMQFTVGVVPMLMIAEPVTVIERVWNPFKLIYQATERMVVLSWRNLVSIRKMFTGDVSVSTLGGPIMIGKIAGEALTRGLIDFLSKMAIFSIGLGVLNVLPIPVLDGGHILLLVIEGIRKKPLSLRQMEIIQVVGLVLILALMGLVFKNDITRSF